MNFVTVLAKYLFLITMGVLIPVIFAIIDMWQLDLSVTFDNLYDVMESQNIYILSLITFPTLFAVLFYLYQDIKQKNLLISSEFEYQKNILNANPDAALILDQNLEYIFCNDSYKFLFEDTHQILKMKGFERILQEVSFFQKEFTLKSNIMDEHPFLVSIKQTSYQGQVNYYISFKDIKDQKEQARIIEDQNQQMIEKNKLASLGEMAAGIAHEINNPLTVISSNNSLLTKLFEKDKLTFEKLTQLCERNKTQVERITEIIKSLRSLSHGMANDDMENFALHELVEQSVNLAKIRDKQKRIIIKLKPTDTVAFGNRGQIVQVILNLLNNAIDAIENQETPWIEIETTNEKNHIIVNILDSGKGIPTELQDKIFVPMFTSKPVGKGTGLGLSLSKSFMNQNMGDLDYETRDGHTCFKVTLLKGIEEEIPKAS